MSVNDDIQDYHIRQAIKLIRLGNAESDKFRRLLGRADERIKSIIMDIEGPASNIALGGLRGALIEILNDVHANSIQPEMLLLMSGVAQRAFDNEVDLFKKYIPSSIAINALKQRLEANLNSSAFQGATVAQWLQKLNQNDFDRVWRSIYDGFTTGRTNDEIVRDVFGTRSLRYRDGVREVSRRGIESLTRTVINHASNVARQNFFSQNKGFIKAMKWVSTLDSRTSHVCAFRDGHVGPVDFSDDWSPPSGYQVLEPPLARPPAHMNCRSVMVPVVASLEEMGLDPVEYDEETRSSLDGSVPATTTFYEWIKGKSESLQMEFLGKTRFELWKSGKVKIDGFVNDKGELLTLDELRSVIN